MKKIYLAIIGAVVMFSLNGCDEKMSSVKYNETVVAIHTAAESYLQDAMSKVNDDSLTQEEKQQLADSVAIKSNEWYNQLKALEYPDVAKDLQASLVTYLSFQKDSLIPVFQKLILSVDEDSFNANVDIYNDLVERDEVLNNAAGKAQEEFAAKINMKLH
jgi:uncharacterized lipoprotein YehR (DUF1307 family)